MKGKYIIVLMSLIGTIMCISIMFYSVGFNALYFMWILCFGLFIPMIFAMMTHFIGD